MQVTMSKTCLACITIVSICVTLGARDYYHARIEAKPNSPFRLGTWTARDIKDFESKLHINSKADLSVDANTLAQSLRSFYLFAFNLDARQARQEIQQRNANFPGTIAIEEPRTFGLGDREHESVDTLAYIDGVYIRESIAAYPNGGVSSRVTFISSDFDKLRQLLRAVIEIAATQYDCDDFRLNLGRNDTPTNDLELNFRSQKGSLTLEACPPLGPPLEWLGTITMTSSRYANADTGESQAFDLGRPEFWQSQVRPYPLASYLAYWGIADIPGCTWERNGESNAH